MELITVKNNEIIVAEEFLNEFSNMMKAKIKFDKMEQQVKEELKNAMENNNIKSFENDLFKALYVAPTTRKSIDSKKLREEYPLIAQEVEKVSEVKSSLRLSLK